MAQYDVFGIGSALMDFLIEVDHNQLAEFNLNKGQFHLIDEAHSKEILDKLKNYRVTTEPGGSSANTLYGIGILGGTVVFCGKVGRDPHGDTYEEKMINSGVKPVLARSGSPTGHAITFITPDSERTFAVHLGAAMQLEAEDVFFDDLKNSGILHVEGYQLEAPGLRKVSMHAMQFAKQNGIRISIDLGDPGIVARNKKDLRKLVADYADIVFANEEEAMALTGLKPREALDALSGICDTAIVKVGRKGSMIKQADTIHFIPGYPAQAIDTTGAGDMFAAGVLYGISKGHSLKVSGHIGSFYAAKVVGRIGARLDRIDQDELDALIRSLSQDQ
ncbi:MAG: adenosine kinase [archaeon]